MIRAGILGAGGFTGQELISIFRRHPQVSLDYLTSSEYAGKKMTDVFGHLQGQNNQKLLFSAHPQTIDDLPPLDVMFLATPDQVSLQWAPQLVARGIRVVDIAGSFRLKNAALFQDFYNLEHNAGELLAEAVYGLPEKNRALLGQARLVANPGCYPTAALLPLLALESFFDQFAQAVIVDAKSGTSGAGGRKEKDELAYSGVNENFRPYKVAKHQHQPEIEQELNLLKSGQGLRVRFTPHLLPLYRGIECSSYLTSRGKLPLEQIQRAFAALAEKEPFLRYYADPNKIEIKNVANTNFADFSFHFDQHSGVLSVISAIDNLQKGAAGQAVQNLNLMFGLPETTALL